MKMHQPVGFTLVAALCSTFFLVSSARADFPALKVAVANTSRVFNDMQETKDLKEKLEVRRKEITGEEQERQTKVKRMQQDLQNLKPDHPQFKKMLNDLDTEMANLESWEKLVRIQAERDQKTTMKMLFDKIQGAVAEVAKDQGIDVVIADQGNDLPNVDALNFDQLRALINQRNVLYSSPKADISESVLTLLDQKYDKQKSLAPAKP